ncbi:hypothetical protein VOLCADRAFT_83913 [Volvox carteri f. nagariensis]|uniref:non-specific serine/threonine protein kinase n=1 Tax=Volvox carteri f. nagariensis TaxID=3068 RepID=D8UEF0_VOLCA|nr:uncharacterized protein VOLCADRAFT_83913 [Volvox carteri f. nagariensis]EFJ41871.1 hypothetical protein VOLCADRAFT_83913 [Volvox carteri f. nagariensis]|eukprot:XP_002957069.1 hypothetical protein VOLCADRAFT_83913 [Volvox carteri f. nagariensis]
MAESQLEDREHQEGYRAPRVALTIRDFHILGRIGDGSFSTVFLAQQKQTGKQYAIKMMNKHLIMRNKVVEYIKNERFILDKLDDAGIAKLHFTFQDPNNLYMGMEYCAGGELYEQIKRRGGLPLDAVRFYAAEVVLILQYLRSAQVVHRDLKPENLLLSADGHLKLIDFGSARASFLPQAEKPPGKNRATSFVGTAEYVSPEVLLNQPLSYPADLWALGCLLYQMIVGRPPFKAASEYLTFQKITDRDFCYPEEPATAAARDLTDRLLAMEPSARIGESCAEDISELKAHPFFAVIDWETLRSGPAPSFLPPTPPGGAGDGEEGWDWELTSLVRDAADGL